MRPPLLWSITRASTISPASKRSCIARHLRSRPARRSERTAWPSGDSGWRTYTRTSLPTWISGRASSPSRGPRRFMSSRLLTTPSLLPPKSTRISSGSIRTTVPSTTSPCLRLLTSLSGLVEQLGHRHRLGGDGAEADAGSSATDDARRLPARLTGPRPAATGLGAALRRPPAPAEATGSTMSSPGSAAAAASGHRLRRAGRQPPAARLGRWMLGRLGRGLRPPFGGCAVALAVVVAGPVSFGGAGGSATVTAAAVSDPRSCRRPRASCLRSM